MPRRSKTWAVQLVITDSPEASEKYMTQRQIKDEILRYGCSSAGIKLAKMTLKETTDA